MVQGGPAVQLAVVLTTVVGLWVGARPLVDAAVRLARRVGLSELAIGLTVVAVGTSTPELAVSLDAAYKGFGDIAVANVLGSNIYNLAFILGVVALFRPLPVAPSLVRPLAVSPTALETLAWLVAVSVVAVAALWTGHTLSRAEGGLFAGSELVRWALGLL